MVSFTPSYQLYNTLLTQRTVENSIMYSPVKFISWQCNSIYTFFLNLLGQECIGSKNKVPSVQETCTYKTLNIKL